MLSIDFVCPESPTLSSFNLNSSKSYAKYNLQNLSNHLEIKFRFATKDVNQSKALLLFMCNETNESNYQTYDDFMSITVDSGWLSFTINLGQG